MVVVNGSLGLCLVATGAFATMDGVFLLWLAAKYSG